MVLRVAGSSPVSHPCPPKVSTKAGIFILLLLSCSLCSSISIYVRLGGTFTCSAAITIYFIKAAPLGGGRISNMQQRVLSLQNFIACYVSYLCNYVDQHISLKDVETGAAILFKQAFCLRKVKEIVTFAKASSFKVNYG